MLELTAALSPNPAIAAASSTSPEFRPADGTASSASQGGPVATPFATVLQSHISRSTDTPAAEPGVPESGTAATPSGGASSAAPAATEIAGSGVSSADPGAAISLPVAAAAFPANGPVDAIALLAAMLAGNTASVQPDAVAGAVAGTASTVSTAASSSADKPVDVMALMASLLAGNVALAKPDAANPVADNSQAAAVVTPGDSRTNGPTVAVTADYPVDAPVGVIATLTANDPTVAVSTDHPAGTPVGTAATLTAMFDASAAPVQAGAAQADKANSTGAVAVTADDKSNDTGTEIAMAALLAPMLAGSVAAGQPDATQAAVADNAAGVASASGADKRGKRNDDDKSSDAGAVTALPLTVPIPNAANPVAATSGADRPNASSTAAATKADTAATSSAILAATAPIKAESPADTGKAGTHGENFDALVNAARDTQMLAGQNAVSAHAATPAATATATVAVATPVGTPAWENEVGDKLTWMVGRQETRADLVLNPPQLGRIEVSLSMKGDQANAVFVSANPAVRDALENALPRLREILQDAGISLGQTQVGAESFQQSANNRENGDNPSRGNGSRSTGGSVSMAGGLLAGGSSPSQWLRRGNGLVDTFA